MVTVRTHYEVLNLQNRGASAQDVKLAYRRALLLHHPDKQDPSRTSAEVATIDEITAAYNALINEDSRRDYDRKLALESNFKNGATTEWSFRTNVETVDLDDLEYDEQAGTWYRSCRCGLSRSYKLIEENLVQEERSGEIIVGCIGCSLWLRVVFVATEDGNK